MLLRRDPVLGEVFLGEVDEGTGKGGVVGNKSAVEIGKA